MKLHVLGTLFVVFCTLTAPLAIAQDAKQKIKSARQWSKEGSWAISKLAELLSDSSSDVRLEAAKAIAQIGTGESLTPLVKAAADNDPEVQARAIDGLVNFYLPGYVQGRFERMGTSIKSKFTDTNDQIIPPFVKVRPDVVDVIARDVRGGSSMESRATAARAAGILRANAAVPDLIQAMRSKDDALMYESIVALRKINDPKAAPAISVYIRDFNERVQLVAIESLGLLHYREAIPDLQKLYAEPRTDKAKRAALAALAMLPDPSNRKYFIAGLRDPKDDAIRTASAEGYARLKDPADMATVEKAFEEERKIQPRLAAAFALVAMGKTELGETTPLSYLIHTLNSKMQKGVAEPYLRELAVEPMVREQIYASIPNATKDEKLGIASVLAATGDSRTVAHLEQLSRDPDSEVAQESAKAVRTLRMRVR